VTRRPGFTIVELVVALSLFSAVLVTTLGFYRQQGRAFTEGNDRMTVMQNLRYGVSSLEQGLRTAGVGVPTPQPVMVYAGPDVVSFNADYASNIPGDVFAVYHEPRLPDDAATALTPDRALTLPGTSFTYPTAAYYVGASNSPAETITFFFASDSATARTDDFVLYRQVNDLAPEVLARRLLRGAGPFFTYYGAGTGSSPIAALPTASLPVRHGAAVHGSPADTGRDALVDGIRAVRVAYAATNGLTGAREARREISRMIRLPNAGLGTHRVCGAPPILGTTLTATGVSETATTPGSIRLQWSRALDEVTGELDVIRYVIWRKGSASDPWGDPLASVPPGSSSYVYVDSDAEPDRQYWYAVAAQDCTPQYSAMALSGPVDWNSL
jgi:type II secretory pathway pseudopilin PulG